LVFLDKCKKSFRKNSTSNLWLDHDAMFQAMTPGLGAVMACLRSH
jgi:hypothetical protein